MKKSVRLADIGARLGVSTVTVSKALSGQKGVSDTLRKQIEELADSMGYVPPSKEPREEATHLECLSERDILINTIPFICRCISR